MKSGMLSIMVMMLFGWMTSHGQNPEAEVPGDHFSLEGALELFKKSESPEHFEKLLNSPDSKVNNLDLNGDGYIDYIRVFDRYEDNVHVFILQAVVTESENQDIAVIELEKKANGQAVLQIIGDEDIYGVTTIIEPTRQVRTYAGSNTTNTVVNVWSWPVVQYVYGPRYVVWHSPWSWHHRPVWWSTWRPVVYVHYHHYWRPYRSHYVVCHTRRVVHAHHIYYPHRRTSVVVHNRHHAQVTRYRTAYSDNRNGRTRDDHRNSRSSEYRPDNSGRSDGNRTRSNRDVISSGRQSDVTGQGNLRTRENRTGRTDFNRERDNNKKPEFQRTPSSDKKLQDNNFRQTRETRQLTTPDNERKNTLNQRERTENNRTKSSGMSQDYKLRQSSTRSLTREQSLSSPKRQSSDGGRSIRSGSGVQRQQSEHKPSGGSRSSSERRRGG